MEGLVIYDSKMILQSTKGPFNGYSKEAMPRVLQLLGISRVMPRTIFRQVKPDTPVWR
jgi:hypothetical protein